MSKNINRKNIRLLLGWEPIDGAVDAIEIIRESGKEVRFLSNNSSKSASQYCEKLHSIGIQVELHEIILSTHGLIDALIEEKIKDIFLVGTKEMAEMIHGAGIHTDGVVPEIVVLGYDTELTYDKLAKASLHLQKGVPLWASHPDLVCPSPEGDLPDVGSILTLFETSCGVTPSRVCGKPNLSMVKSALSKENCSPQEAAMIGDRISTDLELARVSGMRSILVLSGEAKQSDVEALPKHMLPDLTVESLRFLFN